MKVPAIYRKHLDEIAAYIKANDREQEVDTNLEGIVADWLEQQQELYKDANQEPIKEMLKHQIHNSFNYDND